MKYSFNQTLLVKAFMCLKRIFYLKISIQYFSGQVRELRAGKKATIIFVPVPQLGAFQKIQTRLVRELEKKLANMLSSLPKGESCPSQPGK